MSKLDELINKLCPDGVPFLFCKEIVLLNNYKQLGADELEKLRVDNGTIPLLPSSRNYDWYTTEEVAKNYICHGEIFTMGRARHANTKYVKGAFVSANNIIIESKNNEKVLTRYLFHYLSSKIPEFYIETSTYPKFDTNLFNQLLIPVPPMEVQCEIVRILDNFTELTAELTAELTVRQKQYSYYMDAVFSNVIGKNYLVGDLFEVKTGKGITKKDASIDGNYPIISGGKEPMGYYKDFNREANTVTISRVGANAGFVMYIDKRFYLNDKCFSVIPFKHYKNLVNSRYLYFFLKRIENDIIALQSEGGVPTINTTKVSSIKFVLPSLDDQQKIVDLLNSFNIYCSDLYEGLPAEISARQKQYEYYRDKLLSFKELKA